MTLSEYPDNIKPYIFHGIDLESRRSKWTGTCPFCDKEGHFEVKSESGKFRCYLCDLNGNIYTFLLLLFDHALAWYNTASGEEGPFDTLDLLAKEKEIPLEILELWQVVPSTTTGDLLIPAYNVEGKLANLYKIIVQDDKWLCLSSPGCKRHSFGMPLLKGHKTLYLCEGPWDGMNLYRTLADIEVKADVLALPGIHGFTPDILSILPEKVEVLFDNDYPQRLVSGKVIHPVWSALKEIRKKILEMEFPPSLHIIKWGKDSYHDPHLPNGYDISDLILSEFDPQVIYQFLNILSKRTTMSKEREPVANKITRTRFKQLCQDYESVLHFPQALQDSLAVLLATITSTELGGDQLWLRLLGRPGSGKTTLAEAVSACREYVFPISMQTGFHSGFVQPGDKDMKDHSLLAKMDRMTTIIKDGDVLLTSKDQARILGEMRDFFDGSARAHYRNMVEREYENLRTTFVICGTDDLRRLNRSSLGERFLDCEVMDDNDDGRAYVDRALDNAVNRIFSGLAPVEGSLDDINQKDEAYLKETTSSYIIYLKENLATTVPPNISKRNKTRIKCLARFLALARAKRVRETKDDKYIKPRAEVATRLTAQFTKLCICLSIVLNRKSVDGEIMRIARKVAMDSAKGYELDIIHILADNQEIGTVSKQLVRTIGLTEGAITTRLNNMSEFGITTHTPRNNHSGQRGRNAKVWYLTSSFEDIYIAALS